MGTAEITIPSSDALVKCQFSFSVVGEFRVNMRFLWLTVVGRDMHTGVWAVAACAFPMNLKQSVFHACHL